MIRANSETKFLDERRRLQPPDLILLFVREWSARGNVWQRFRRTFWRAFWCHSPENPCLTFDWVLPSNCLENSLVLSARFVFALWVRFGPWFWEEFQGKRGMLAGGWLLGAVPFLCFCPESGSLAVPPFFSRRSSRYSPAAILPCRNFGGPGVSQSHSRSPWFKHHLVICLWALVLSPWSC